MKKILSILSVVAVMAVAGVAPAAIYDAPVPTNAYITINGLDWAWASPFGGEFAIDLVYQAQFGWHVPTANELTKAPIASQFLFSGANVPVNTGLDPVSGAEVSGAPADAAIAVPYFNTVFNFAEYYDAPGTGGNYDYWNSSVTSDPFDGSEFLLVRNSTQTPIPSAVLLLGSGLACIAAGRRRVRK